MVLLAHVPQNFLPFDAGDLRTGHRCLVHENAAGLVALEERAFQEEKCAQNVFNVLLGQRIGRYVGMYIRVK
jgi:hypothetical protein